MQSFLLAATQNNIEIKHIKGTNNSLADFASRNSIECTAENCSVCKFINSSTEISVYSVSVTDIVNGSTRVPFSNPVAWLQIQLNCPVIQLARKHIQEGTRPLKKLKNLRDVKQLIRVCSVSRQGLLIVRGKDSPFQIPNDLTVIPSNYMPGLLTAMHLQLNHPSHHQLKQVFNRQFYSVCSEKVIQDVSNSCHQCASLKKFRVPETPGSTSAPYSSVGSNFTSDIIKRSTQNILVLSEEVTKFTKATLIESERQRDICQGLKELILPLHPACSPVATLKLDPAPAMRSLFKSQALQDININIVLGEPKNRNKMATIDKQIQELENEFTRLVPLNSQLSRSDISCAVSSLNSRIRSCGLSSYEQWHRRSQFSQNEINPTDKDLINQQHENRVKIHNRTPTNISSTSFQIGSIVYVVDEKTKHSTRPRYIVDSIDGVWLFIRKLTENQIRTRVYKIHKNRCVKVTSCITSRDNPSSSDSSDEDIHYTPPEQQQSPQFAKDSHTPATSNSEHSTSRKSTRQRKSPERLGISNNENISYFEHSPELSPTNTQIMLPSETPPSQVILAESSSPDDPIQHNPKPCLRKSTRPRKPPKWLGIHFDSDNE